MLIKRNKRKNIQTFNGRFRPKSGLDGKTIIYSTENNNDSGISIINSEGGNSRQILTYGSDPLYSNDGRKISFGYNNDVYVYDFDSRDTLKLADGALLNSSCVWTNDDQYILFWSLSLMDIARINVSDKSILPLQLINTGEEVRSMAFSNDGPTLVISKGEFGGKMNLWQVRFNTTTNLPNGKPILLNGISSTDDINPSFSADGKIAYSKRVFERHLWMISAENNNVDPEQLTTTGQLNYYPELTYDGKILGFTSHRSGNGLIYTYNFQTQKSERISNDWEKNLREVWISFSQDTYPIYYTSTKGGSFQIWTMQSPNSPPLTITKTISPQKDISASISPDGNTLVFLSNRNGNDDVWTYDLRSAKINQLTSDHSNERFPVWSPDGNQIAFLSDKTDRGTFG